MHPVPVTLFWIALSAVVAPLLASLVPRRVVPEVVLLLVAGMVIGPNVLDLAGGGEVIVILHDLGLALLFLLAGYELDARELAGRQGRLALGTWLTCFLLALALVVFAEWAGLLATEIPIAIALTSTALGTLLPILKDSGQSRTRLGAAVLRHGAYGELGPVVAMAVLLSNRGSVGSILVLVLFAVVAVLLSLPATLIRRGSRFHLFLRASADTTAQLTVRLVVLLLISFTVLALAFALDVVLGAFAAGFVLRRALAAGDLQLEHKLEGLAFGLFIPLFFVTSGMSIDPRAVIAQPLVLAAFVLGILLLRGGPIYLATRLERDRDTGRQVFSGRDSMRIALYGATGLPIIVAVTAVAVAHGDLSATNASLLITGGAVTVLVLPATATLLAPRPIGSSSRRSRQPA